MTDDVCTLNADSPFYCDSVTVYVRNAYDAIATGDDGYYDWMSAGTTGCCIRGYNSINLREDEYYRLACTCSEDINGWYADGYWKVYYFQDEACNTYVGETSRLPSGWCGSASSVSVSLFASLVAVFAALKSM